VNDPFKVYSSPPREWAVESKRIDAIHKELGKSLHRIAAITDAMKPRGNAWWMRGINATLLLVGFAFSFG
jgi:hypothetical protein